MTEKVGHRSRKALQPGCPFVRIAGVIEQFQCIEQLVVIDRAGGVPHRLVLDLHDVGHAFAQDHVARGRAEQLDQEAAVSDLSRIGASNIVL